MRHFLTGFLALLLFAMLPAHAQVDLERYLKPDGYGRIKISPDGKHFAALAQLEDRVGISVFRRSDKAIVTSAVGPRDSVVDDFWWVGDDRLVLAMAERLGSRDEPYLTGQLFGLGLDGKRIKVLVGPEPEVFIGTTIGGGPWEMATLIDPLPDDPRNVLISTWGLARDPITSVERLDAVTGRRARVATAPVNRAVFLTDAAGRVRFARGAKNDNYSKLYHRHDDKSEWRLINDQATSGRIETAVGFSADGALAYLEVSQPEGPDAIVSWNPVTDERKQVLRDPTVDAYSIIHDVDGSTLLGAQYMSGGMHTRWLENTGDSARLYRALEKAFPEAAVSVTSRTRDGTALVQVWNDRTPGDTYLFDPRTMTATGVHVAREWFDPAKLPKMEPVTLKARDGLELHGYLTRPVGAAAGKPLPMVVMPHGGPYGIFDQWAFHDDTQLLAEAGYAVLRINFRGSGNHGVAFRQAGAREWGGSMQDDLTDATRWATTQGTADKDRICIYGASYGGYAALMGVAKEPGLYRCAVGYVGVYDLEEMHRKDSASSRSLRNWMNDWIGSREDLEARSPVSLASHIKAPVFLAAGGADVVAPIVHSKRMAKALKDAGNPAETLFIDSEGHGFYTEEHRREFYTKLLDFLARHLGGARAANK